MLLHVLHLHLTLEISHQKFVNCVSSSHLSNFNTRANVSQSLSPLIFYTLSLSLKKILELGKKLTSKMAETRRRETSLLHRLSPPSRAFSSQRKKSVNFVSTHTYTNTRANFSQSLSQRRYFTLSAISVSSPLSLTAKIQNSVFKKFFMIQEAKRLQRKILYIENVITSKSRNIRYV